MPFFKDDTEVKSIEHAIGQTQWLVQKEKYTMLEKVWERWPSLLRYGRLWEEQAPRDIHILFGHVQSESL